MARGARARGIFASGDKKAALVEYPRFLEHWNSADSNLPELAEARRAVTASAGELTR